MFKKSIFALSIIILASNIAYCQLNYDNEAIMYSMYQYKGTARSAGVNGAFGTVGPDAGGLSINPAIVATYRSTEFCGSFGLLNLNGQTNYLNRYLNSDNRFKLTGENLSMVFASSLGGTKPHEKILGKSDVLKGFGLGISATRIADFNGQSYFEGNNDTNSFIDFYREVLNNPANNINSSDLTFDRIGATYPDLVAAYQAQMFTYSPLTNSYYTSLDGLYPKKQTGITKTNGGITDLSVQLGFNLWDKLFIGGSIGMPYLSYSRDYLYTESDYLDTMDGFSKLSYNAVTKTEGIGFNGKFGFIVKPVKYFSFGASISTPTSFTLKDKYYYTMEHTTDSSTISVESPIGAYQYNYTQPYRFNAGLTGFFDKYGFISVDYELVDYRRNKFNFGNQARDLNYEVNDTLIKSKYQVSHNFRAGIELAYKVWRIRGGYGISLSPFRKGVAEGNADLTRQSFSAGAGYRGKRFSIDIAWVRSVQTSYFSPYRSVYSIYYYNTGREDAVITKNTKDNIVITFGIKFKS